MNLTIKDLEKAKAFLMGDEPPMDICWHCGNKVISRLKTEVDAKGLFNQPAIKMTHFAGIKVIEDQGLPDNVFEMRDQDGNVLQRYSI